MTSIGQPRGTVCFVLREDADLAHAISPDRRLEAIETCTAQEVWLPAGDKISAHSPLKSGLGILVLSGLLVRRVGIDGRFGAELLGEGDLLRPWQWESDSATLPLEMGWSTVEPARLVLLDEEFVRRSVAAYPELAPCFVGRAMQRARNLAVNMAIVHQARVDSRLHMLLWHLAGRWGRVRTDGTVVPFRLTHSLLADLVAARRPTVTSALSDLARRGLISSRGGEWVLFGEPPRELLDIDGSGGPSARDRLPPLAASS
ncbi:MAG: Crp/Fnr family transcriptional regulator [Solirubrobacterales bacterium]|nr:Crp/Fnr family transcriptional regulator [Solirubrobacterales bacterium]